MESTAPPAGLDVPSPSSSHFLALVPDSPSLLTRASFPTREHEILKEVRIAVERGQLHSEPRAQTL